MALMGKNVTIFCCRYIYTGKLISVNKEYVLLEKGCKIVFRTGKLDEGEWTDAQNMPGQWYVQTQSIESFGILK